MQPFELPSSVWADKACRKLAPKFYEPFQVLACIGPVAYKLTLLPKCRIHVVFLKKFMGTLQDVAPRLPPIKHGCVLPKPEKVLRAYLNRDVWEILVQWMGQLLQTPLERRFQNSRTLTSPFSLRTRGLIMGEVLWTHSSGRRSSADPSQRGPSRRQKEERAVALEDGRCCTQDWKMQN
jgi:hypothetical protein